MRHFSNFIAGEWRQHSNRMMDVLDKYDRTPIAQVVASSEADVDSAVRAARAAFETPALDARGRSDVLVKAARLLAERKAEFVTTIVQEGGQTVAEATREVTRAVDVLINTAEESNRVVGDMIPLEGAQGGAGKIAFTTRHPLGVVCAITPFNSPLNTPIHKIAPAIAAGNPVVCKPASQTPISCLLLAEVLHAAGLPPGWFNVLTGSGQTAGDLLMRHPEIAFYHFTGSTEVGMKLSGQLGLRRASLELGSIAVTIIADDVDLEDAIPPTVKAAFAKAGQVCTSTQIIYAERKVFDHVCKAVAQAAAELRAGDPQAPSSDIGPLISPAEAERVAMWVTRAVDAGATLVAGGSHDGPVVQPIVLLNAPDPTEVICREVFGPVVTILCVDSIDAAIARFNALPYGLSVGVFTRDLDKAFQAATRLRSGTIHVNAPSSSRIDLMPFGGVKDSGHGKEGPRYALREMTEERLIVFHNVAPRQQHC
jgi:succinate-semialdehyde dehydrogenase/glutarate-semialdehyde dehydrogenase